MKLQFTEVTQAKLTHVNVRRELHGEEKVPAFDLSFQKEGTNEMLDMLDKALRPALYFDMKAEQGQSSLPDALAILPNLRVPSLNGNSFDWAKGEKYAGYTFVIDHGLGDRNAVFEECTVKSIKFDVKEGGTVIFYFVVQYSGPALTDEVRARLTDADDSMFITLVAPSYPMLVGKGKKKAAAPDATTQVLDGMGLKQDEGTEAADRLADRA